MLSHKEKRNQLEKVAAGYRLIGLSEAESYVAAGIEKRFISEADAVEIDPLSKLGILTKEFTDCQATLENMGYICTASNKLDKAAQFVKSGQPTFIVKMDGSWSCDKLNAAGDQLASVHNGVNAFDMALLVGVPKNLRGY